MEIETQEVVRRNPFDPSLTTEQRLWQHINRNDVLEAAKVALDSIKSASKICVGNKVLIRILTLLFLVSFEDEEDKCFCRIYASTLSLELRVRYARDFEELFPLAKQARDKGFFNCAMLLS